jgi:hypothetical protein
MTTWFVVFSFTRTGCSCQALSWTGPPNSRCVMLQPKSRPAKSQASTCFPVALTLTKVAISSGQARKLPKWCVFGWSRRHGAMACQSARRFGIGILQEYRGRVGVWWFAWWAYETMRKGTSALDPVSYTQFLFLHNRRMPCSYEVHM